MKNNPQKILTGRYQVVPRSIILLINQGKVLLQKGSEHKKIFPGHFNGIGGHIERGEDVLTSAKRELFEETGLSCEDLHLSGTIMIDVTEDTGILLFVFNGGIVTGELKSSEEGDLDWVEIDQLANLLIVEDVPDLVAKIQHHPNRHLFFGTYKYDENGQRITSWETD